MQIARKKLPELCVDQDGQTTLEWVLLMIAVGIPMIYAFRFLLDSLAELYRMVTFIETLPFP